MPLRYEDDHYDHHEDNDRLNLSHTTGSSSSSGNNSDSFLDEQLQEEGRITFHHEEDPLKPEEEDESSSFNSEEFQAEEKEAITKEIRYRRNKMYALVGVAIVVLLAIIVIPVTIVKSNNKKGSTTNNKTDDDTNNNNEVIEIPTDNNKEEPTTTTPDVDSSSSSNQTTTSPVGAVSGDGDAEKPASNVGDDPEAGGAAEGNPFFQEEQEEPAGGGDGGGGNQGGGGNPFVTELMDVPEAKPSSLSTFTTDILKPYSDRAALQEDITLAAQDMVHSILLQNLQMIADYGAMGDVFTKDATTGTNAGAGSKRKIETSKNNGDREADVREGDTVQEDGMYVYAAYGDTVVVWNRFDGTLVTQEQMPAPSSSSSTEASSSSASGYGPWIHSVHLTEKHLLVFAGGYGTYDYSYGAKPPVTRGDNSSKLFVYNRLTQTMDDPSSSPKELIMVATQSLNGQHLRTRYLTETDTFHIITGLDVNTGGYFGDPLTFLNFFPFGMQINATDYYERATKLANEQLIPDFVEGLTNELMENNQGQLPTTLKVNSWQTPEEQQAGRRRKRRELSPMQVYAMGKYGNDEGIRSYVQILTLKPNDDLPVDTFESESLKFKSTVVLGPSADIAFHASGDDIVLALDRFNWDTESQMTDERLFVLQLKVNANEGSTSFYATTSIPGRLGMPMGVGYPMDIQGDDLRVATTFQGYFPLDNVYGLCGHPPGMGTFLFGMPPDKCTTDEAWMQCHDLVMDGCGNVTKSTSCPYTFECADESDGGSSTENHVVVLGLSGGGNGEMPERGRVRFGNDHDFIQALHFGEDFSYALTSRYGMDGPFYVLNLSHEPSVTYTLQPSEIKGGGVPATYLQPINEAGTLLVGIGQNSTGSLMFEVETGLTVSVIDVSDPNAPVVLASEMLKRDESFTAPSSSAQFDARSVQYTDNGMLIIPLTMYPEYETIPTYNEELGDFNNPSSESNLEGPTMFEGFIVLDLSNVAENGIKEVLRLNHVGGSGRCDMMCSNTNFLPNHRSFWYEDENSLMTMFDHKVFSTNMATLTENWGLNISPDDNCCF